MERTTLFPIRHYECDAYGHLNNIDYVRFLSEATFATLAAAGYAPPYHSASGQRWRVQGLEIEYLRPVRYGDQIQLTTAVSACGAAGLRWVYEFRLAGADEPTARAQADVVFVADPGGEAVTIPSGLQESLSSTALPEVEPLRARFPIAPPPPPGAYTMARRVNWQDLSAGRQVSEATYLGFIEECSMGVVAAHGWPPARMAEEGFAIILRRHQFEYLASARLDDELLLTTWASDVRSVAATRHYAITRSGSGELLGRVHTLGVCVNLDTGRPMRMPPRFIIDFAPNLVM